MYASNSLSPILIARLRAPRQSNAPLNLNRINPCMAAISDASQVGPGCEPAAASFPLRSAYLTSTARQFTKKRSFGL